MIKRIHYYQNQTDIKCERLLTEIRTEYKGLMKAIPRYDKAFTFVNGIILLVIIIFTTNKLSVLM